MLKATFFLLRLFFSLENNNRDKPNKLVLQNLNAVQDWGNGQKSTSDGQYKADIYHTISLKESNNTCKTIAKIKFILYNIY